MAKISVVWGRRTPIGVRTGLEQVHTMTREFGSAKKAAEFASDILYVRYGPEVSNAHTEKFYMVSRDRPRVEYMNNTKDEWVLVERQGA